MPEDRNQDEEAAYEKVDRRATSESEPEPETPPVEQAPELAAEEAPAPEPQPAQDQPEPQATSFADVGVFGILRFSVSLLAEAAWMSLGMIATPGGETREDFAQARVAIDSLTDMVAHLQPDLDASEKRELEQLLANLRVNFIQRSG